MTDYAAIVARDAEYEDAFTQAVIPGSGLDGIYQVGRDRRALIALVRELRAALKEIAEWGAHCRDCNEADPCSCGWTEIVDATRGPLDRTAAFEEPAP